MPVITALEAQARDPERLNVYLDGSFALGVSRMLAYARHLHEGRELTQDDVESLRQDDAVDRAYNAALNFLSYRPRSRGEIERYFRKRGTEAAVGAAVIERLQRSGLIDDSEFARFWVENRQTFRPRSARALRVEMRQKGLDREVIDEALEGLGDEEEIAYVAGRRKTAAFRSLEEREYMQKMLGFLQRRGFHYEAASRAARRLYEEGLESE